MQNQSDGSTSSTGTRSTPLRARGRGAALVAYLLLYTSGCQTLAIRDYPQQTEAVQPTSVARELEMVTLPEYVVEHPDILLIEVSPIVPKQPYRIQLLDVLGVFVSGTVQPGEIQGEALVQPDGTVALGPGYGSVRVVGLSLKEAEVEIVKHLRQYVQNPEVVVQLAQSSSLQPIQGEHVIYPDGTVNLGLYGKVFITGMTLTDARDAISKHLSQFLESPRVAVDVLAYNSKFYYVVLEGAGAGDRIVRLPITGNDTVFSAIATSNNGLLQNSSREIWVARPTRDGCSQILPVDWNAVTANGSSKTNYQLMPGDRVFVREDRLVAVVNVINKLTQPMERLFSTSLLTSQTLQTIRRFPDGVSQ